LGAIEDARARIAYGKNFKARQAATTITAFREMLLKEYGTWPRVLSALDVLRRDKPFVMLAEHFGLNLLKAALINPKALRLIADALQKLDQPRAVDHRATAIISAYKTCGSFPPSFIELKRAFVARFGESRWRGDFSVRKTLRSLNLPLSKSKRGRPIGSRSKI
jgi:hypothetical protein